MFEWDEKKLWINISKHGSHFELAWEMEWGKAFIFEDTRKDYSEVRFTATAPIEGRLYCCSYTWRNGNKRIISLRKANKREIKRYVQKTAH